MDKDDVVPRDDPTYIRWDTFMTIVSLMTIAMCLPAIFLIKDKPPSPPSMVATIPKPV